MIGQTIAHYTITEKIGEGGMGEVYRATDTKLKRDVALKVLPESFTQDPQRMARFTREAQVLASLNHPNIGAIHGLEEEGGVRALVLELIDGEDLSERIARGPIPLKESLKIALQIAEALEAAHEKGIIHRDLKPANVKLTPDGQIKVLDFGLAKALDVEGSAETIANSPTLTMQATQAGIILGTAAYMSPEQAKGLVVDRRCDVWSFGAVLFEMLSGQRAFEGSDVSEVLASVLAREPDWTALPEGMSPVLRTYLRRCLHKDPKQRIADVQDLRLALEGAFEMTAPRDAEIVAAVQPIWRRVLPVPAAFVVGGLFAGLIGWNLWPTTEPAVLSRFIHSLPNGQFFRNIGRPIFELSPDGRSFVYNTRDGLYLRRMDELEARLLAGTEASLHTPFFSPDGKSVGYFQDNQLKRINVSGGPPRPIIRAQRPFGASWAAADTILFGQPEGIVSVSANGGTKEVLIQAKGGEEFVYPQLLPQGRSVLFAAEGSDGAAPDIMVQSLTTGRRTLLVQGGTGPRYLPSGHLVYAIDDGLFGAAFDPDTQTIGESVPLVQGVMRSRGGATPAVNYGVSETGTLVYVSGGIGAAGAERGLQWGGRDDQEERLTTPSRNYINVSLSPGGSRAALEIAETRGETSVWVTELSRGTLFPLTTEIGFTGRPLWSLDDRRVVFTARREGRLELRSRAADGTGSSDLLAGFDDSVLDARPASWTPDGTTLAIDISNPGTGLDIGLLPVDGSPAEWRPLIQTPEQESKPAISPDGRWIAYQASYSGDSQIYVERFPDLGDRRQVSVGSSVHFNATWAQDGSALYYVGLNPLAVKRATITADAGGAPVVGTAEVRFTHRFFNSPITYRTWDLSPDADRILMIVPVRNLADNTTDERPQIIIIQNWIEELRRLVPTEN